MDVLEEMPLKEGDTTYRYNIAENKIVRIANVSEAGGVMP
jgi:hypothetical protein